jgi:hypothetical protein
MNDGIKVKGCYRIQITEDDEIVGDSGWHENLVVNLGFNQYLVSTLGAIAGSKQISHMALGTGGAPTAAQTSLAGETDKRTSVTAATSSASKTLRLTATFGSSDSFVTASRNISNSACLTQAQAARFLPGIRMRRQAARQIRTLMQLMTLYFLNILIGCTSGLHGFYQDKKRHPARHRLRRQQTARRLCRH